MKIKIKRWNFVLLSKSPCRIAQHDREKDTSLFQRNYLSTFLLDLKLLQQHFSQKFWLFPSFLIKFLHALLVWKIFNLPALCSWTFWHNKGWHNVLAGALEYMKNHGSLSLHPVEVDTILSPSPKGYLLCQRMISNLTLHRCGPERSSPGGKLVKNTMFVFVWG